MSKNQTFLINFSFVSSVVFREWFDYSESSQVLDIIWLEFSSQSYETFHVSSKFQKYDKNTILFMLWRDINGNFTVNSVATAKLFFSLFDLIIFLSQAEDELCYTLYSYTAIILSLCIKIRNENQSDENKNFSLFSWTIKINLFNYFYLFWWSPDLERVSTTKKWPEYSSSIL